MRAFENYQPIAEHVDGYRPVDEKTIGFFKDQMIKQRELVLVSENHEESPLFEKMQNLLDDRDSYEVYNSPSGVSLFLFKEPFPFIHGDDTGFKWFVLPRAKALEI